MLHSHTSKYRKSGWETCFLCKASSENVGKVCWKSLLTFNLAGIAFYRVRYYHLFKVCIVELNVGCDGSFVTLFRLDDQRMLLV